MNQVSKFVTVPLAHIRIRALTVAWQGFVGTVFDPYRPERHYMRGRGPKWRARHGGEYKPPII
ncbi:MAG TPA: hypothetical protein VFI98_12385 [Pseudolabrys sp.]|nr:hypothetical protein [Pseudolabrys sp.]